MTAAEILTAAPSPARTRSHESVTPDEAIAILRRTRAEYEAKRLSHKERETKAQAIVNFHEAEQANLQEQIDHIDSILFERFHVAPEAGR